MVAGKSAAVKVVDCGRNVAGYRLGLANSAKCHGKAAHHVGVAHSVKNIIPHLVDLAVLDVFGLDGNKGAPATPVSSTSYFPSVYATK